MRDIIGIFALLEIGKASNVCYEHSKTLAFFLMLLLLSVLGYFVTEDTEKVESEDDKC